MRPSSVRIRTFACAVVACFVSLAGCIGSGDARPETGDRITLLLTADQDHPISWLILSVEGRGPTPMTKQTIMDTMTQINGEGSHHFMGEHPFQVADDSPSKTWTRIELIYIAAEILNDWQKLGQAFTAFVYLNGEYTDGDGNGATIGVAIQGMSFIFSDQVSALPINAAGLGPRGIAAAEIERAVSIHEFGHVIGLVDNGIPMLQDRLPHKDDDPCQCHSSQEDSVMYYIIGGDRALLEHFLQDGSQLPYTFNDADWSDIRSFQEANSR